MTSSGDTVPGALPGSPSWGVVATIKANAEDILAFAAYHLDLGARRLYLYLDADCPGAHAHLKAHPRVRVTTCDAAYWKRVNGRRPVKHQVRQTVNATHAYHRRTEVDWLIHMDVDEFLWPQTTVSGPLGTLPPSVRSARIRPLEQLSGDGSAFKRAIPAGRNRAATSARLYPSYGHHLKGGFLSHVQGKVFVRSGAPDTELRIHSVFQGGTRDPDQVELREIDLCHCHAPSWERWVDAYHYRLEKGSYRADLSPAKPRSEGGLTLHEVLGEIERSAGLDGLRAFYDEVCADTPDMRRRLEKEGLLQIRDLGLAARIRKHFRDFAQDCFQKPTD